MGIDVHSIDHLQEHEARLFPVVRISFVRCRDFVPQVA